MTTLQAFGFGFVCGILAFAAVLAWLYFSEDPDRIYHDERLP